ncbi:MAG: hypothetical protein RBT37_02800 [Dissulfurispiraceae bacterium]|nr:hypothetical protein [Dissulfurispiraceae bacterium]
MQDKTNNDELKKVLLKEINSAMEVLRQITEGFTDCANSLRVEQNERVFTQLSELIKNLNLFVDFIKELKTGIDHLNASGCALPVEPLIHWDKSLELFKNMLESFEGSDWVTLCDLIQYELIPMLTEGDIKLINLESALR